MMPRVAPVKATAKAVLKTLWPSVTAVCLILGAVLSVGICVAELLGGFLPYWVVNLFLWLYFAFITAPLALGIIFWLWRATESPDVSVLEIFLPFSGVSAYLKNLSFIFASGIKAFFAYVVVMLPYFAAHLLVTGRVLDNSPVYAANAWVFENLFQFAGTVLFVIIILRHYMAPVLFMVGQGITANEAIFLSRKVGKVSFIAFAELCVSFIGWAALSVLALPLLYTLPYFLVCLTVHARFAITHYNGTLSQNGGRAGFKEAEDI